MKSFYNSNAEMKHPINLNTSVKKNDARLEKLRAIKAKLEEYHATTEKYFTLWLQCQIEEREMYIKHVPKDTPFYIEFHEKNVVELDELRVMLNNLKSIQSLKEPELKEEEPDTEDEEVKIF
jgi:uridine kinase